MSKQTQGLTAIPRPQLGDLMYRHTLIGLREEAMVVSISGPETDRSMWSSVMMTKNGVEFVGSDQEHRGKYDWVPLSWQYDEERKAWVLPKNAEQAVSDAKAVDAKDWDLPTPVAGERYMTWRARALREVPGLRGASGAKDILSDAWKEREQAAPAK
tara:strand:+ start:1378 stop:1848 length:471 start_codon:yes stop_codon:yes gene_type:complete